MPAGGCGKGPAWGFAPRWCRFAWAPRPRAACCGPTCPWATPWPFPKRGWRGSRPDRRRSGREPLHPRFGNGHGVAQGQVGPQHAARGRGAHAKRHHLGANPQAGPFPHPPAGIHGGVQEDPLGAPFLHPVPQAPEPPVGDPHETRPREIRQRPVVDQGAGGPDVETRSAKRAPHHRVAHPKGYGSRAPRAGGLGPGPGAYSVRRVPHALQNTASGRFSAPQAPQVRLRGRASAEAPHAGQNLARAVRFLPQRAHRRATKSW